MLQSYAARKSWHLMKRLHWKCFVCADVGNVTSCGRALPYNGVHWENFKTQNFRE